MDPRFTCDGEDISPHLAWEDVPKETKSLALSLSDPDAPSGNFIHWLVINIPAETREIPSGGPLPKEAEELVTDFGKSGYGGPCPPSGTHHYEFRLFALKSEKLEEVDKSNFSSKIAQNKIAEARITGLYRRD